MAGAGRPRSGPAPILANVVVKHGDNGYPIGVPRRLRPEESFLDRLDAAITANRLDVSGDALETAEQQLGWGLPEIVGMLLTLDADDFAESKPSTAPEGGVIWVFTPMIDEGRLWVRLCERGKVVVVSFHRG